MFLDIVESVLKAVGVLMVICIALDLDNISGAN